MGVGGFLRRLVSPARGNSAVQPQSVDATAAEMQGVNDYWQQVPAGGHRRAVGGKWDEIGRRQFDFLKEQGLKPDHTLLDVGCGCLRGGVHFVRYLEPGNYYGIDINSSLLEAGEHELKLAGLLDKQAHLLQDAEFRFSRFERTFDFGIAVSVFTHLYANHIARCLAEMPAVMHGESRFYASFFQAPRSNYLEPLHHEPGGVVSKFDADPFHYSLEEFQRMAGAAGLVAELVGDWNHPRDQRMLCFRTAQAQSG